MEQTPKRRRKNADQNQREDGNLPVFIRIPVDEIAAPSDHGHMRAQEIALLAASIARHGLLQPVVVRRRMNAGRYLVVLGERRLAALRLLGWKETDAILIDADDAEAAACILEDEAASACKPALMCAKLVEKAKADDVEQAYALYDRRVSRLCNLLRLRERTRRIVESAHMSLEQAEPLLKISDEQRQAEAASIIAERELTPAQARRLVGGPQSVSSDSTDESRCTRRRAMRAAMEEVADLAHRLQSKGISASVSVHSQEGGMCIQLMLQKS